MDATILMLATIGAVFAFIAIVVCIIWFIFKE